MTENSSQKKSRYFPRKAATSKSKASQVDEETKNEPSKSNNRRSKKTSAEDVSGSVSKRMKSETGDKENDNPVPSGTMTGLEFDHPEFTNETDLCVTSVQSKSKFEIKFPPRPSDIQVKLEKINKNLVNRKSSATNTESALCFVNRISDDRKCNNVAKQARKRCVLRSLASFEEVVQFSPFNPRVTSLTYHPEYPALLAAGSKGGDVFLWETTKSASEAFRIPGIGPGGSILALKFHHEKQTLIYTASLYGQVMQKDFLGRENKTLFEASNFDIWFCSLDTLPTHKILLAGDTKGYLYFSNLNGENAWKTNCKIHKNKVTHLEFSQRDPNTFVTASVDHTVKLWDLRMLSVGMKDTQNVCCLTHKKGVNSAYFSPSNGASLLTTDQDKELRVYSIPYGQLEATIPHPHRHFQHMTHIKAQWHPIEDFIVVGRYPDPDFCANDFRSIDIYDRTTDQRQVWFATKGINSLSVFNPSGDVLASASGSNISLWKPKDVCRGTSIESDKMAVNKKLLEKFSKSRSSSSSKKKPASISKKSVKSTDTKQSATTSKKRYR